MTRSRSCAIALLLAHLTSAGCTTLREVPRERFGESPERKGVRVETTEGLVYEFDYAGFDADSLTGYRHRDTEGAFEHVVRFRIALDDVQRLSARTVDWYRTGLVGGGLAAALIAAGLAQSEGTPPVPGSGGGGPRCCQPSPAVGPDR